MLILQLNQFRQQQDDVFEHFRDKTFVIFELDDEINTNPLMDKFREELKLLRYGAPREYKYLAVIANGAGDKDLREKLHRDCMCVRPKALSQKEIQALGLPSHKVIKEKTGHNVSYKLMTQVKER